MFGLTDGDVAGLSILDCCAGASSYTAESRGRVVAVDPAYAEQDLAGQVWAGLREGDRIIGDNEEHFDWSWYGNRERRTQLRTMAARLFLDDFRQRPHRYVAGALPNLPFADSSFDLVLCSHLLFTWSDVLPVEWHRRAFAELVRVARREIRVFPLVLQGVGTPVSFLHDLRAELGRSELRTVAYRFQRNADRMLVVDAR
jgi:SAM-dependent methyltransferase